MLETFLANLKFAIRNKQDMWIGGGHFTAVELEEVWKEIMSLKEALK